MNAVSKTILDGVEPVNRPGMISEYRRYMARLDASLLEVDGKDVPVELKNLRTLMKSEAQEKITYLENLIQMEGNSGTANEARP